MSDESLDYEIGAIVRQVTKNGDYLKFIFIGIALDGRNIFVQIPGTFGKAEGFMDLTHPHPKLPGLYYELKEDQKIPNDR